MNLLDFLADNKIKTIEGISIEKTDEQKVRDKLEKIIKTANNVPFINEETGLLKRMDLELKPVAFFKHNKKLKKTELKFTVLCTVIVDGEGFTTEWETKDEKETMERVYSELDFHNFLRYNNIIFDGRYLRNFEGRRVIYEDKKVRAIE